MRRLSVCNSILYANLTMLTLCAVILLSGCAGDSVPEDIAKEVSIVPEPRVVDVGEGGFLLRKSVICIERGSEELLRIGGMLADIIEVATGYRPNVKSGYDKDKNAFLLSLSDHMADEEYTLNVTEELVGITGKPAGLFYAVQTIRQLLPAESLGDNPATRAVALPCVRIEDSPRFPWRGMHLDVSRHFMPVDFIKKQLDLLAMHRMNVFHWHLIDGTGWRLELDKYPLLTEKGAWRKDISSEPWDFTKIRGAAPDDPAPYGGFYTKDEVREIIEYAAERYITVVPEIEMPGHSHAALYAYPEYLCSNAEKTKREFENSGVFCAGREETFEFLEDILDEVIELFPCEYIHIGGDEVPKRFWKACPECQARMKAEGLQDEEELQSYFVRRMETYIVSKGRRLLGWDEINEGGLAPEATVMSWRGMGGGITAAKAGHDVIMTPSTSTYFNLYQGDPELEPKAWGGFLPLNMTYDFDPVPDELTPEEAAHILGAQGCLWTEFVQTPEEAEYMFNPRLSAISEVLWTPKNVKDWDSFRERMMKQYRRFDALGINYAKSAWNVYFNVNIDPENFNASFELVNDAAGMDIRYTLDGSQPSASSTRYETPFELSESALVRAASFIELVQESGVRSESYTRHLASGIKPLTSLKYSSRFAGAGKFTLTNCRHGSKAYGDGQWQGFLGDELVVDIDLGELKEISSVASTSNHNPSVWLFMAEGLAVELSPDGKSFEKAGSVVNETDQRTEGPYINELVVNFEPVRARYVKARIKGLGICPEWHIGAGAGAWLFVDEIVVK